MHGLSIPLGKLGFYLPRTLSQAFESSASEEPQPFRLGGRAEAPPSMLREHRRRPSTARPSTPTLPATPIERPVYRIGGTVIRDSQLETASPADDAEQPSQHDPAPNRTIKFPDEAHKHAAGDRMLAQTKPLGG